MKIKVLLLCALVTQVSMPIVPMLAERNDQIQGVNQGQNQQLGGQVAAVPLPNDPPAPLGRFARFKNYLSAINNSPAFNALKKTALIALGAACAYGVYTQIPEAANNQAQGGVLVGVAKDIGRITTGIGKSLYKAGQYIGSYATVGRVEAAAAAGLGYVVYNRTVVNAIKNKYFTDDWQIKALDENKRFRVCTWDINHYKNHLIAKRDSTKLKHDIAAHVKPHGMQTIMTTISNEKKALENDLEIVESYVSYFRLLYWVPFVGRSFGVQNDLNEACVSLGATVDSPNSWSHDQFVRIDGGEKANKEVVQSGIMAEKNKTLLPYLTLNVNYHRAAELWWNLKKLQYRLNEIEAALKPVEANLSSIPVDSSGYNASYFNPQGRDDFQR